MSQINLQRDQMHVRLSRALRTLWGTSGPKGNTINCNANPSVGITKYNAAIVGVSDTNSAANWSAIGLFMQPPTFEAAAYKVKAAVSGTKELYVIVGYGPASPIDGNNAITNVKAIPIPDGKYDDVILLDTVDSSDGNYGLPICFGVAIGEVTGTNCDGYISVQRLSTAPPTFSSSVS